MESEFIFFNIGRICAVLKEDGNSPKFIELLMILVNKPKNLESTGQVIGHVTSAPLIGQGGCISALMEATV